MYLKAQKTGRFNIMRRSPSLPAIGLLLCLGIGVAPAAAQTGSIAGVVRDAGSGEPLPGVNVAIEGTTQGTSTGLDGEYTIQSVAPGTYTLLGSFVGYKTARIENVQVASGRTTTQDLRIEEDALGLEEVVVVGYGTQRRADLTGSISSVRGEELREMPLSSLDQALQGRAAGVQVRQTSAAPGRGISIRVRGGASITGGNEPLYVIDGIPLSNDTGGMPTNPMAALNPDDIESIDILKDASSTAIYGARGANGVVLITTRRGSQGRTEVSFDSNIGMQEPIFRYDMLDAQEYAAFANEWAAAQGLPTIFTDASSLQTTNWQDEILQTAPQQDYNLAVSGGNAQTRFAVSGGYFNQEGVVRNTSFQRISLRTNLDHEINSRFKLSSSVTGSRMRNHLMPTDGQGNNIIEGAILMLPVLGIQDEAGNYIRQREDVPWDAIPDFDLENPVALRDLLDDQVTATRFLGNVAGEYEVARNLRLRVSLGADIDNRNYDTYMPRGLRVGNENGGNAWARTFFRQNYLNENTLTFNHAFNANHRLNAVVGYTLQVQELQNQGINNSAFVTDATGYNDIGAGARENGPNVWSGRSKWSMASYLGRANYTLLERYLFTFTFRADGSSRFGDDKWGVFPSGALAWRVSEEPFLQNVGWLSNLKLRASVGLTGNPEIPAYQSLARLGTVDYGFGADVPVVGYVPVSIANPGLTWEKTRQVDAGIDIGLFGGRLDLTADYYYKHTTDLLLRVQLPYESGFSSALQNMGNVDNRGFELALGGNVLDGDLYWRTDGTFSYNENEVVELGESARFFGEQADNLRKWSGGLVEEGQPLGAFFGYRTDGLFQSAEEVQAHTTTLADGTVKVIQATAKPGDRRFLDLNGDGLITADDRTVLGSPHPKYLFGWNNRIGYKGLELSVFVQGVAGNKILSTALATLERSTPQQNITQEVYDSYWRVDNPGGRLPRLGTTWEAPGDHYYDTHLRSGSYLRARNIELAYRLPRRVLGSQVQRARLSFSVQNAFTITDFDGFNVETNTYGQNSINAGLDYWAYPVARSYTLGVSLGF